MLARIGKHRNRRSRRSARLADERGTSTLEAVVILPIIFMLIFAAIQAAVWFHARNVATTAAQEAARAASAEDASAEAGHAAATQFITTANGQDFLNGLVIEVDRSATTAQATVTATAPAIVSEVLLPEISQSAAMPVERLTEPGES